MYRYTYTYIHAHMRICFVFTHIYIYIHTYKCIHYHTLSRYVYYKLCVYIHIYIYIFIHTCTCIYSCCKLPPGWVEKEGYMEQPAMVRRDPWSQSISLQPRSVFPSAITPNSLEWAPLKGIWAISGLCFFLGDVGLWFLWFGLLPRLPNCTTMKGHMACIRWYSGCLKV